MKKRLMIIVILATLLLSIFSISAASDENATVFVEVHFKNNLIFSKYDVDIYMGDEFIGTTKHGNDFWLVTHQPTTIYFYKHDDKSIYNSLEINQTTTSKVNCDLSCHRNRISIDNITSEAIVLPSADDKIIRPSDLQKYYLSADQDPQQFTVGLNPENGGIMLVLPDNHDEMILTLRWLQGGCIDLVIYDQNDRIIQDTYWNTDWSIIPEYPANTFPDRNIAQKFLLNPACNGINQYMTRNTFLLSKDAKSIVVYCSETDAEVIEKNLKSSHSEENEFNLSLKGGASSEKGLNLETILGYIYSNKNASEDAVTYSGDYAEAVFEIISLTNR